MQLKKYILIQKPLYNDLSILQFLFWRLLYLLKYFIQNFTWFFLFKWDEDFNFINLLYLTSLFFLSKISFFSHSYDSQFCYYFSIFPSFFRFFYLITHTKNILFLSHFAQKYYSKPHYFSICQIHSKLFPFIWDLNSEKDQLNSISHFYHLIVLLLYFLFMLFNLYYSYNMVFLNYYSF